jgi:hypothetical protein
VGSNNGHWQRMARGVAESIGHEVMLARTRPIDKARFSM